MICLKKALCKNKSIFGLLAYSSSVFGGHRYPFPVSKQPFCTEALEVYLKGLSGVGLAAQQHKFRWVKQRGKIIPHH